MSKSESIDGKDNCSVTSPGIREEDIPKESVEIIDFSEEGQYGSSDCSVQTTSLVQVTLS